MSIKMSKETICINQIVGKKTDTIIIEGDDIVPDIKPDILNVISSSGTVCIYKKEILEGKIKFEGSIYANTIYVADDEMSSIRSISSSLDFSKTIDMDNINPSMQLESKYEIKSIDCKILNGRKISLKANVSISINVYANEDVEVIRNIEDIRDIQKLENTYDINSLLGMGNTKVLGKDTVSIDNIDNLSEIIKIKTDIRNRENKISYNKVLAKADCVVKIIYLTDDNRINTATTTIPIMGFLDIQNVNEENICDTMYELKNILVKPNNVDEHSIYVETEIEITSFVYETKRIEMMEDLYSPSMVLEYQQKNVSIMQSKRTLRQTCNIRKQQTIPEIGKNRIYDVDVRPVITNTQILNGRVSYEGEINLTFLHETQEGSRIAVRTLVEPFSFNIADDKVDSKTKIDTNIEVSMQDFIVMPDESIDMKIDLEFNLNISSIENLNIISDVRNSDTQRQERYSIVIYYTKTGDTLWNIAKRFGSTIDEIVRVNKIENQDMIMPGEQLFIPR